MGVGYDTEGATGPASRAEWAGEAECVEFNPKARSGTTKNTVTTRMPSGIHRRAGCDDGVGRGARTVPESPPQCISPRFSGGRVAGNARVDGSLEYGYYLCSVLCGAAVRGGSPPG